MRDADAVPGYRFGHWTVVEDLGHVREGKERQRFRRVRVRCDCGTVDVRKLGSLRSLVKTSPEMSCRRCAPGRRPAVSPLLEVARATGVSHSTFWYRVNRNGWTPEKAATTPAPKRSEYAAVDRMPDGRLAAEAAKANGIKRAVYANRRWNGWEIERAATQPVQKQVKRKELVDA